MSFKCKCKCLNIISINKTVTKKISERRPKLVFVVSLRRAVLNGSTKSRFTMVFLTFRTRKVEEELTVSFISF